MIQLCGTGFGPAEPATQDLKAFSGAFPFRNAAPLKVKVRGLDAEIVFNGRTAPGLDQLNVRIPYLAPGDYLIEIEIGGAPA